MESLRICTVVLKNPFSQKQFLRLLVDAGLGGIAESDDSIQCLIRDMEDDEFLKFLESAPFEISKIVWGGDVEIRPIENG